MRGIGGAKLKMIVARTVLCEAQGGRSLPSHIPKETKETK